MKITLSPPKEAGHLLKGLKKPVGARNPLACELLMYPWLAAWAGGNGHPLHATVHAHVRVYVFGGEKLRGLLSLQHQNEQC